MGPHIVWTLSLPGICSNASLCIKCDIDLISSKVSYYITSHVSWVLEGESKHPDQRIHETLSEYCVQRPLSSQHYETFCTSISLACHKVTLIEHPQDTLTGVDINAFHFCCCDIMLPSYLTGEYRYHCISLIVCLCKFMLRKAFLAFMLWCTVFKAVLLNNFLSGHAVLCQHC